MPALQPSSQASVGRAQASDQQDEIVAPDALTLFISQSNHRIKPGGFVRGPDSKK